MLLPGEAVDMRTLLFLQPIPRTPIRHRESGPAGTPLTRRTTFDGAERPDVDPVFGLDTGLRQIGDVAAERTRDVDGEELGVGAGLWSDHVVVGGRGRRRRRRNV